MVLRLFEFAEQKKEVERELKSKTVKIIEHILYLVLDKNNSAKHHWESEIFSFLHDIDLLKGSNKLPKEKFIYDSTYGKRRDRVTDNNWLSVSIRSACYEENIKNEKPLEKVMNEMDYVCSEYFSWISKKLSTIGRVAPDEVFDLINSLLDNVE